MLVPTRRSIPHAAGKSLKPGMARSCGLASKSARTVRRADEIVFRLPQREQTSRLAQSGTSISAPCRSACLPGSRSTRCRQSWHQTCSSMCALAAPPSVIVRSVDNQQMSRAPDSPSYLPRAIFAAMQYDLSPEDRAANRRAVARHDQGRPFPDVAAHQNGCATSCTSSNRPHPSPSGSRR